jgi:predicted permease
VDKRGLPWLADLTGDVRYGLRGLIRDRGLTTVVILLLALGIGITTSVFTLIDALMLRTLPVRAPEQLVYLLSHYPGDPRYPGLDWKYYELFRDQNHVFSDLVGTSPAHFQVATAGAGPEELRGEYVVGRFFPALGLHPAAGRLITDDDDRMTDADVNVAVVSWSYWQRHFNLDPAAVGTRISVNGVSTAVIGVTPPAFTGIIAESKTDVWLPIAIARQTKAGVPGLGVIGRLKPGVSIEAARAEMSVLNRARNEEIAGRGHDARWLLATMEVEPAGAGLSVLRDSVSRPLFVLMAGAGLLLLLGCTNVASLLLARAAARRREMAVRVSLGAGRFRLVRHVLTESLLLAAAGTLAGLFLAYFGAAALVRLLDAVGRHEPLQIDVRPDGTVLLFSAIAGLGTAIIFGMIPAWQAFAMSPASCLRDMSGVSEPKSRRLFGQCLVVAQVALSAVLLSTSCLFGRYLSDLRHVGLGFDADSVLLVSLNPRGSHLNPAALTSRYRELLDRLQAIPGVRSVSLSATTPIAKGAWLRFGHVDGFQEAPDKRRYLFLNAVAPRYFETMGTAMLAGRDFEFQDAGRPRVAIVNQAMARYYFPDRSALGRHVTLDGDALPYEIVGVVADAKYESLHQAAPRTVYLNAFQEGQIGSRFALRTRVPPLSVLTPVRRAIDEVVKPVRLENVTTLTDQMDASIVLERTLAGLSGVFGAMGALLAAMGLYGLLAYTVTRRRREIGVRMALGATRRSVVRMVVKGAFAWVLVGLVLGTPAAVWSGRFAAAMIESLPINDPFPIAYSILAMTTVAIVAAYVPARRAARVQPVEVLRHE